MDRRRGNRKDVKVVDLEFDRAVFVIPFADGAHVVRVAVGRGDGFLDDGAVVADARDWDRRHSGVGRIEAGFEHRVLILRKHAWFMVKTVARQLQLLFAS